MLNIAHTVIIAGCATWKAEYSAFY